MDTDKQSKFIFNAFCAELTLLSIVLAYKHPEPLNLSHTEGNANKIVYTLLLKDVFFEDFFPSKIMVTKQNVGLIPFVRSPFSFNL